MAKKRKRATRQSARVRRQKEEKRSKKAEENAQKKLSKKKRKAEKVRVRKKNDKGSNPLVQEIYPHVSSILPAAADGKKNVRLHFKCVKVAAGPRIKQELKDDMRKIAAKGERLLRETMELGHLFVLMRTEGCRATWNGEAALPGINMDLSAAAGIQANLENPVSFYASLMTSIQNETISDTAAERHGLTADILKAHIRSHGHFFAEDEDAMWRHGGNARKILAQELDRIQQNVEQMVKATKFWRKMQQYVRGCLRMFAHADGQTTCAKGYEVAAAKVAYDVLRLAERAPTDKAKITMREQKIFTDEIVAQVQQHVADLLKPLVEAGKDLPEWGRRALPAAFKASYKKQNRSLLVIIMVHVSSFFEQKNSQCSQDR